MNLKERINQDLKDAMKSGDKVKLETIRSIRALILEFEKSGAGREINQDDEVKMLSTAVKKGFDRTISSCRQRGISIKGRKRTWDSSELSSKTAW